MIFANRTYLAAIGLALLILPNLLIYFLDISIINKASEDSFRYIEQIEISAGGSIRNFYFFSSKNLFAIIGFVFGHLSFHEVVFINSILFVSSIYIYTSLINRHLGLERAIFFLVLCGLKASLIYSFLPGREMACQFLIALIVLAQCKLRGILKYLACFAIAFLLANLHVVFIGLLLFVTFYPCLLLLFRLRFPIYFRVILAVMTVLVASFIIWSVDVVVPKIGSPVHLADNALAMWNKSLLAPASSSFSSAFYATDLLNLVIKLPGRFVVFLFGYESESGFASLIYLMDSIWIFFSLCILALGLRFEREYVLIFFSVILLMAVFSMFTGNIGTAIRHKEKFSLVLAFLVASSSYFNFPVAKQR